ncbi:putative two-component system, response regulator [Halobacteriovorax marinus SJ]|uniref:Two-component system, response regulator n=1 Tax=Halobacteriovorax marinus (strain ATCC BAA-682 / DSM 15412 / SJ) TaxID=862908 RepID=E1X4I7_HALMS|nr:response regulator [Halobacteriovorax marinus]CBW25417.1 putative two-component system, response regulator [Halobacteriovorax marinus SJ]
MSKILIVDDEIQICEMMADLFESRGHDITVAHSGNKGAEVFSSGEFDLVISDVKMPDGDGFELARLIGESAPSFNKIIFVTGYLDVESAKLPENVKRVFKKPVRFKELLACVEEILS